MYAYVFISEAAQEALRSVGGEGDNAAFTLLRLRGMHLRDMRMSRKCIPRRRSKVKAALSPSPPTDRSAS